MNFYKFLQIFTILFIVSCQSISVPDGAPSSDEMNHMRVETEICGSHKVGINGCFWPDGNVTENLKVFNVAKGSIRAVGCGIDQSLRYDMKSSNWAEISIKGMRIEDDCVITLYQLPEWPGQDRAQFPIYGMKGQVFMSKCLAKQTCHFYETQGREQYDYEVHKKLDESGIFMLRGCGVEKIPPTKIDGELHLNLGTLNEEKGCIFYLLIKTAKLSLKEVYWLNSYKNETMILERPSIVGRSFEGDKSVMAYIQNERIYFKNRGKIEDGFVRFYTSSGRSLVVQFKNGEIIWIQ